MTSGRSANAVTITVTPGDIQFTFAYHHDFANKQFPLDFDIGAGGGLVTDAHLAALAIEHGALLCSTDRDFGRFPGLRWADPLVDA